MCADHCFWSDTALISLLAFASLLVFTSLLAHTLDQEEERYKFFGCANFALNYRGSMWLGHVRDPDHQTLLVVYVSIHTTVYTAQFGAGDVGSILAYCPGRGDRKLSAAASKNENESYSPSAIGSTAP